MNLCKNRWKKVLQSCKTHQCQVTRNWRSGFHNLWFHLWDTIQIIVESNSFHSNNVSIYLGKQILHYYHGTEKAYLSCTELLIIPWEHNNTMCHQMDERHVKIYYVLSKSESPISFCRHFHSLNSNWKNIKDPKNWWGESKWESWNWYHW